MRVSSPLALRLCPCIPTGIRQPKCGRIRSVCGARLCRAHFAGRAGASAASISELSVRMLTPFASLRSEVGSTESRPTQRRAASKRVSKIKLGPTSRDAETGHSTDVVSTAFGPESCVRHRPSFRRRRGDESHSSPNRASSRRLLRNLLALRPRRAGCRPEAASRPPVRVAHTATPSITPTQWSALSSPLAKVARSSKTASENPPTFRMSARSAACVEA